MKLKQIIILSIVFCTLMLGAYAQETAIAVSTTSVTTWVLDDFDDHEVSSNVNIYNGGKHAIIWDVVASQYITRTDEKPYPQKAYVPGVPAILVKEFKREPEAMRVFGIRAAFNTKGINVLTLIPTDQNNTLYVDEEGNPLEGVFFADPVYKIGMYALGIMRNYEVYANFESEDGRGFSLPLGDLNYTGWKILSAEVPIAKFIDPDNFINRRYLARLASFSIRTTANDRVDDFVLYMDQIFYTLSAVNTRYYDGYELLLPDYIHNRDGSANFEWEQGSSSQEGQ